MIRSGFLLPTQIAELDVAPRQMPAPHRGVVRIAGDEIEIEVELTEADLADLGGFVAPIPRVFA